MAAHIFSLRFSTKVLSFLLFLLVCSLIFDGQYTLAQNPPDHNVDSDSVFYLTDSFLKSKAKNVLDGLLAHFELKSANQNLGSSPTVQLNNVDVAISPDSYQISDSGDGLAFVTQGNVLRVNIGEIGIHESVQRNINGVIAIIRIDVSCVGASLTITDPQSTISSQLLPGVNGNLLQINLVHPSVHLVNPAMVMSHFQCTGAQGFEDLIRTTIQTAVTNTKDTNSLLAMLLASNSVLLDSQLSFNWNEPRLIFGKADDTKDPQGWILPAQISMLPTNDWQSTGTFRVILPTTVGKGTPIEKFAKWPLTLTTSAGYVAMPDTAFVDIVKNYFAPKQWQYKDMANNYKAFSDLLASGFDETFLWSDLKKYPKTQPFPITVTTVTAPQVTWASASSFNLSTTFLVHMMTNGKPYADFTVPTQALVEFEVQNNQLVVKMTKTKIKVSYKWAPSYCSKDCSGISTQIIADAMQTYLSNAKFTYDLPPLVFVGTKVNAQSVTRDIKTQTVVLQLSPN